MTKFYIIMIMIPVLGLLTWGCVGGASHISVGRDPGSPGSTDDGETGGTAGGELPQFFPPITENTQIAGGGAVLSESANFKSYGGSAVVFGGTATGDRYRSIAQDLRLGAQKIGGKKK